MARQDLPQAKALIISVTGFIPTIENKIFLTHLILFL
jgi:hypothetical protein